MDDDLYLYYVALTTKAKDRRPRRSAQEKLSYTARDVLTFVFPPDPKNSPFTPMATVLCVTEKTVYLIR